MINNFFLLVLRLWWRWRYIWVFPSAREATHGSSPSPTWELTTVLYTHITSVFNFSLQAFHLHRPFYIFSSLSFSSPFLFFPFPSFSKKLGQTAIMFPNNCEGGYPSRVLIPNPYIPSRTNGTVISIFPHNGPDNLSILLRAQPPFKARTELLLPFPHSICWVMSEE